MADKIVVMRDGIVEQIGSPLQLYDHPANTFVAAFIGSPAMNLIEGTWQAGGVRIGDAHVPVQRAMRVQDGQKVLLGTRPEHLEPRDGGALGAKVEVIEPTGADTMLMCSLGAQELTVVVRDRVTLRPGDPVRLAPMPDKLHVFDAASGKSLSA
jgi:multiple sugar transport system ATP-binding protein